MYGISHKIALRLDDLTRQNCVCAAGTARFVRNRLLVEADRLQASGTSPTAARLSPFLTRLSADNPWIGDVPPSVASGALDDLTRAITNHAKWGQAAPRPRQKGIHDSFHLAPADIGWPDDPTVLTTPLGPFALKMPVRDFADLPQVKNILLAVVVSRHHDDWFVSLSFDVDKRKNPPKPTQIIKTIGIDLGISHFATLSDGTTIDYPDTFHAVRKRLRRLFKAVETAPTQSRRNKLLARINTVQTHLNNIKKDFIHKFTSYLVDTYDAIAIETLDVKGMLSDAIKKDEYFFYQIQRQSFFEFGRQLTYKTELYGKHLVKADQFFPSSKLCSACGHVIDHLDLDQRDWTCPACRTHHNRDHNAAKNLDNQILGLVGPARSEPASGRGNAPPGNGEGRPAAPSRRASPGFPRREAVGEAHSEAASPVATGPAAHAPQGNPVQAPLPCQPGEGTPAGGVAPTSTLPPRWRLPRPRKQ
ncbi:MAG: RNA-guided endonuclease TnpB family protein [Rhodospirillaceae bacterium]